MEKVADILKRFVEEHDAGELYLAGGTCCLAGIEHLIKKYAGDPDEQA